MIGRRKPKPAWKLDKGAPDGWQRHMVIALKDVHEVLCAGTVGSGKTDPGVMMPVIYRDYRRSAHFKGLVLRHNGNDLDKEIYQRVTREDMYPRYAGGGLNETTGVYRFRSGGRVIFGHTKNIRSLQGGEYQYVWFDELTHWETPEDYIYVCASRLRSSVGLPIRVRAGTNPGGPGQEWVRARWGPWLAGDYLSKAADGTDRYPGAESLRRLGFVPRVGPDGRPRAPVDSGVVLWYVTDKDTGRSEWAREGTPTALSRTCLRTTTADNRALASADPMYEVRSRELAALRGGALAAQLRQDDWDMRDSTDEFFSRAWFDVVTVVPPLVGVIRRWDFAWTVRGRSDWTVGVKFGWTADGHYYVLNVVRLKGRPEEVFKTMLTTAQGDGRAVPVVIPMDGTASHVVYDAVVRQLAGYQVVGVREHGKKEVRIGALKSQATAKRLHLVQGVWNEPYLDEVQAYRGDGLRPDDQLDATAGAFLYATGGHAPPTQERLQEDTAAWGGVAKALDRVLSRAEPGWDDGGGWGDAGPGW